MNDRSHPPKASDTETAMQRAARMHAAGDAAAAAAIYRGLAETHPNQAGLWALLGDALRESGDPAAGAEALANASRLAPDDHDFAVEWALSLLESGNNVAALKTLEGREDALRQSERGQAVLADAYRSIGQLRNAIDHYRRLLEITPGNNNARISLGVCLQETNDLSGAIIQYEHALELDPDAVDALSNLGLALSIKGRHDKAIIPLERAVNLEPHTPSTHCNLGAVLQKMGRTGDAARCFEHAIEVAPGDAKAWSNLGNARQDQLRLDEACTAHARAADLAPNDADIHWNRAMTLLLSGDFAEGFAAYEWRRRTANHAPPAHESPRWDGNDPNGQRLLLISEQGFGDAIQFIRYGRLLQQRGAEIVVQCHPKLVNLFATLDGPPMVIPTGAALPLVDAHVPLMSLPHLFKTTDATVPAEVPYLRPPPNTLTPPEPTSRPCIGLCWTGNPDHPDNVQRSCPFDAFGPLIARAGIEWRSLQFGPAAAEAKGLITDDPEWKACLDGFANTAAALQALNLVITIDTVTAHLAGAMGLPVWLMLKHAPDWRWMTGRADSPWYPTMRLFRQKTPGDWSGVIKQINTALDAGLDH